MVNGGKVEDMYLFIGSPESTSASDLHLIFREIFESLDLVEVFEKNLLVSVLMELQICKVYLVALV